MVLLMYHINGWFDDSDDAGVLGGVVAWLRRDLPGQGLTSGCL